MKNKIRMAVIGCGNMAQAIVSSITNSSAAVALKANGDEFRIIVSDKHEEKLASMKSLCEVTNDNAEAVKNADYIILAIKPQSAEKALSGLDFTGKTVISIMAGVSIMRLSALTGAEKIVRVMPNLCARIGESFSAYTHIGLNKEDLRIVSEILGSFGVCREVRESDMDSITGISGSGPAFVFMTIKVFYDEAVAQGFDDSTAKAMAIQTVIGSALTAEKSDCSFDELIDAVCSKGGTTIAGIAHLNANGYCDILRGAIRKAIERSKEMSK